MDPKVKAMIDALIERVYNMTDDEIIEYFESRGVELDDIDEAIDDEAKSNVIDFLWFKRRKGYHQ